MQTDLSVNHSDEAFFRKRKAMLVMPWIIMPFVFALFWILGGGKGERYIAEESASSKPGAGGFNPSVPNAKSGKISGRDVEGPGYGKAAAGQVLSSFTNTSKDSLSRGLKAIPVSNAGSSDGHRSSLVASAEPTAGISPETSPTARYQRPSSANKTANVRRGAGGAYYYSAPKANGYYTGSDRQLDSQLKTYDASRSATERPRLSPESTNGYSANNQPAAASVASVRLSDNLTASRLAEPVEAESPFLTAPTAGSRNQPTRAVLNGGNYSQKKTIAWLIPVVVHEDQVLRDGQQVKLRLLKEITVDGVTVPTNTILHAVCQLSDDRLRMSVRNLQLGSQLIPLDLDVYDTDGSAGVNVPGLSNNGQFGGQLRSSAIQGVQVPGVGSLGNTVLNSARMGASTAARQTTIRLKAGYNLFLKAQ